jgi:thiol-disulfide isomerase/thioredoxin
MGRRLSDRFILITLVALLLVSTACSVGPAQSAASTTGEAITLDALPAGVGRGFPVAQLDHSAQVGSLEEGEMSPNFQLLLDDGRHLRLQDLRGQPVLLNFWATWCGPCRLEMPEIVRVATTNPDLVVLAINVQESMEQLQPFAEEFQMTLPVVRDTDGELRNLYEVRGMPTSVFIDREGKIFTIWTGILTSKLLEDLLAEMG